MTAAVAGVAAGHARAAAPRSPASRALRRLIHHRSAIVGAGIIAVLAVLSFVGPAFTPFDPYAIAPADQLQPPGGAHVLGTDYFGRDILVRIMYGGRLSLGIGVIALAIAVMFGVAIGLMAGYLGGTIDFVAMRSIDTLMAFPGLLLALGIVAVLGPNINTAMIALGIAGIPTYSRLVRGSVLQARELDYVTAARVIGCSPTRITIRHILPNVVSPVIVVSTLGLGTTILAAASLSFLGMGVQIPTAEWGSMVAEARQYLRAGWWSVAAPGGAIALAVLAINLLGDGLRDALDPRLYRG